MSLFDLSGKVALVTGGTRGIGAECAVGLAEAGADIVLIVRPSTTGTTTNRRIEATGRKCYVLHADLATISQNVADEVVKSAIQSAGRVDILINCGGIQRRHPSVEFPESAFDEVLQVNLKAVWLLSQAVGKHLVSVNKPGKIINFASLLSYQGGLTVPAYAAAKHAVLGIGKALSNEWASKNIQVNSIAPGYIETDMNEALLKNETRLRQISERIPAGRWGKPEDFKGPTVFLASKASDYVSGECLVVDGGWMGR